MLQERQRFEASPTTAAAVSPMSSSPPHDNSADNMDYFLAEVLFCYNQFQDYVGWKQWLKLSIISF